MPAGGQSYGKCSGPTQAAAPGADVEVIRALIAGRAALVAIPIGLGLWAVIGLAVTLVGASLGHHAHLTEWGIALMAAALIGAVTGLPLAARR